MLNSMAATNAIPARMVRVTQHQATALEMRRAGLGYRAIAAKMGLSKSQTHRLVKDGLADAIEQVAGASDELRAEEVDRLDAVLASVWPAARRGNLGAVDRVLRIMERRAKLLGLDAPEKREHSGPNGNPIPVASLNIDIEDYRRIAAEIAART